MLVNGGSTLHDGGDDTWDNRPNDKQRDGELVCRPHNAYDRGMRD
jgi:hypothetical protein